MYFCVYSFLWSVLRKPSTDGTGLLEPNACSWEFWFYLCMDKGQVLSMNTKKRLQTRKDQRLAVLQIWCRAPGGFKVSLIAKLSIGELQGTTTSIKGLSDWPLESFYSKSLLLSIYTHTYIIGSNIEFTWFLLYVGSC